MPIYEYNCIKCGKHFEMLQRSVDAETAKCPDCGTVSKRLISQSSFALKGGGWYKDGYSKAAKKSGGEEAKKETKKTDAKQDRKT